MQNKNEEIQINPGDSVIVNTPKSQPGKNLCCSVRVLNKKPSNEKNFVGQIIEMISIDHQTSDYLPGKIMEFPKDKISSVTLSRLNNIESIVTIEVCDGVISAIWRTDGKTSPVNIRVIDKDCGSDRIFEVSAVSAPLLAKLDSEIEAETGELFLIDEY
jgi:hypothetical protein